MSSAGRVLVTGATGFLGRPAVAALRAGGWTVEAIARRVPSQAEAGVRWHQLDLLTDDVRDVVERAGATHLLHLAWCASPGKFWTDPDNLAWVASTAQLVRAFADAGGRRVVVAGSCAEYDWSYGWCQEDRTPLRPATLYGAAKAAAGTVVTAWGEQAGVSTAWARLFHLYGPGEPGGKLVSSLLDGLRSGREVHLSSGSQVRDFLHSHDAAAALVHLLGTELHGPVNVASGQGVAVRDVARTLAAAAGAEHLIRLGSRPLGAAEPPLLTADVRRLAATGWVPSIGLERGLASLIDSE